MVQCLPLCQLVSALPLWQSKLSPLPLVPLRLMLSLSAAALSFNVPMAPSATVARTTAPVMETKAELVALAEACNPIVGYWFAPPSRTNRSRYRSN